MIDHRSGVGGDEDGFVTGHLGEDLEGSDDVEGRELRIQHQGDLHGASMRPPERKAQRAASRGVERRSGHVLMRFRRRCGRVRIGRVGRERVSSSIEQAIAAWHESTGLRLGADQTTMVHTTCGSGDRYQAVVGRAGTGKTAGLVGLPQMVGMRWARMWSLTCRFGVVGARAACIYASGSHRGVSCGV